MNAVVKITKLDFMMMKSYWKYLLLYLVLPIFFLFGMRSLTSGLMTAMCFLSLAALMIFQTEENSGGAEMSAFLPVTAGQRVAGRYLTVFAIGAAGMACSLLLQCLVLTLMDVAFTAADIAAGVMSAGAFFLAMIAIQFPCIYLLGSIKGRIVSLITIGVVVMLIVLFSFLQSDGASEGIDFGAGAAAIAIAVGGALFVGSAFLSVRIAGRKK